jgi:hypothetical protein
LFCYTCGARWPCKGGHCGNKRSCNGAPGLRPGYGDDYYAAFVIDPDGHHLEAVVDTPA